MKREIQNDVLPALNLTFSPGEKEQQPHVSGFADERPANPVARIFRKAASGSPSPGGEGRGEDGRLNKFLSRLTRLARFQLAAQPRAGAAGMICSGQNF